MIAIVDYGMGNLHNVQKAFEYLGVEATVTSDPRQVRRAGGVVLPGVGAFGKARENLRALGLDEAILGALDEGRPFLGICLGLQLLFDASEERFGPDEPEPAGLGLFPGKVRRLPAGNKVPQIGWNQLNIARRERLFAGVPDGAFAYFVHSYYVDPADPQVTACTTEYGVEFASAVEKGLVMAVQFHPEKSGSVGLKILRNFAGVVASP